VTPLPMHMPAPSPLGLIAGSGKLPQEILQACDTQGRPVHIIALEGETEEALLQGRAHTWVGLASVSKTIKSLQAAGAEEVIFAGRVGRPNFSALKPDLGGIKLITRIVSNRVKGDDVIFTTILNYLEEHGFHARGIDQLFPELLANKGTMGRIQPDEQAQTDINLGADIASQIGLLDIGQSVITQQGTVIGVEAVEGTDGLIKRYKEIALAGKGGVLVKMKKPEQDTRIDLPTIGLTTIENAHAAGLRGIAVEAGGTLMVGKAELIARADALGLFVVGV
jgi:DUF1009 family protein